MEQDNFSLEAIYVSIPQSSSELLKDLVEQYGEERAAEKWLDKFAYPGGYSGSGSGFGYIVRIPSSWEKLKKQLDGFLGDDPAWEEERTKAKVYAKAGIMSVSTYLAGILSPIIGVSEPVLVPAIALAIIVPLKAMLRARLDSDDDK